MSTPVQPITACPDEGLWRAWLDRELPDHASLNTHLGGCAACRATVARLHQDAAITTGLLEGLTPATLPGAAETRLAFNRLVLARSAASLSEPAVIPLPIRTSPSPQEHPLPMIGTRARTRDSRWRVALSGVAAALLLGVLGFTPQGQAAASQFLAQFRGERIHVIPVSDAQIRNMEKTFGHLEHLGSVKRPAELSGGAAGERARAAAGSRSQTLGSIAEAGQKLGFAVKQPDPATLPASLNKTPTIVFMPGEEGRFTFDETKARAYFQSIGQPDVQIPARFNGATLVVSVPSAVMLQYKSADPNVKDARLLIGQAGQVTMGVEGQVTLDELREFLLGLPGMPPEVVTQLRAIQDWRNTLPLPVPVDQVKWEQTSLAGVQGLILNDNSGLGSGALWQKDGRTYGVGGTFKADEIKRVANSLR